jgi:preprotein translocase subunit SecA
MASYERKKAEMRKQSIPVFSNIRIQQGRHIENVVVPFTDGKKLIQVLSPMQATIDSKGLEMVNALERTSALAIIDDAWKEHLRSMDDLKQSVQTASYEQKDPLVIYKMEAFELFRKMDAEVNREIVQFLCHANIPLNEGDELKEGRQEKTDMSRMSTSKMDLTGAPTENEYFDPSAEKQQPVVAAPKIGRNDPCPCGSGKKFKACHGRES